MSTGRHIRPEDEYAQTYYKWRRSVAQSRAQGRSRTRPEDYYAQTYGSWRQAVHERKRRTRPTDESVYAGLPLQTRLKLRYTRRRWLLFSDGFGALAVLSLLVVSGVRMGALQQWGKVPHSMTEATGPEEVAEIYRRNAEYAALVEQQRINKLKAVAPDAPVAARDDPNSGQEFQRLKEVPRATVPQQAPPPDLRFTPGGQ